MFAVFCVVVQHATNQGPASHPELGPMPFRFSLQFGASTLLVISAFFVCVTVRRHHPLQWWWGRIARLTPAYLVAVLVTFTILRLADVPGWYQPNEKDLWGNLLMLQSWLPEVHYVDGAYWTLPIQIMAFTAAALLWPTGWMRGWRVSATLWTIVVAPLVLRTLRTDDAPQLVRSLFDGLGLHRAHLFVAGVAIWLHSRGRMPSWHVAALLLGVLVAQEIHSQDLPSTLAFGVMLLLVWLAAVGPDWRVGPLRHLNRPIVFLAGISYGMYLVNQEIGYVLARYLVELGVGPWGRLVVVLAAAVVNGWLLTRLVERPAHRWLTRGTSGGGGGQIQAGSSGRSPESPAPSPRPVSHASMSATGPRTENRGVFGSLPLISQLR